MSRRTDGLVIEVAQIAEALEAGAGFSGAFFMFDQTAFANEIDAVLQRQLVKGDGRISIFECCCGNRGTKPLLVVEYRINLVGEVVAGDGEAVVTSCIAQPCFKGRVFGEHLPDCPVAKGFLLVFADSTKHLATIGCVVTAIFFAVGFEAPMACNMQQNTGEFFTGDEPIKGFGMQMPDVACSLPRG